MSLLTAASVSAQTPDAGQQSFVTRCARCHGTDGNGGELGPSITARVPTRTDEDLMALFRDGLPAAGMPAIPSLAQAESAGLIRYLRTLRPRNRSAAARRQVTLTDGRTLAGLVQNQSLTDLQLLGDDRRVHLLRKSGDRYRAVTSQVNWPGYNGDTTGYRHSPIDQINTTNITRLAPKWLFNLPNTARLQGTPVVVDGVMYVTSGSECYALDAGTGRQIWHYQRVRTKGVIGNAGGGINRGAAVAGARVFMGGSFRTAVDEPPTQRVLRALDVQTGRIVWELPQAGAAMSWGGTLSTAGGVVFFGEESGAFAAVDAVTGRLLWSFQTNQFWKASPMTYVFDNKQYVAVAAGSDIIAFGLPD